MASNTQSQLLWRNTAGSVIIFSGFLQRAPCVTQKCRYASHNGFPEVVFMASSTSCFHCMVCFLHCAWMAAFTDWLTQFVFLVRETLRLCELTFHVFKGVVMYIQYQPNY